LLGITSQGINAFFVRHDIGADLLPEISPRAGFARTVLLHHDDPNWMEMMATGEQTWDEV